MAVPIVKIPIADTDSRYSMSVCMEFETLFDIPFGIIRTIAASYNDPNVFDQHWMTYDNYTLRAVLYERDTYNPILAVMKNSDREEADSLLQEMQKYKDVYESILNRSPMTSIYQLLEQIYAIKKSPNANIIDYTVICKNRYQEDFIKKQLGDKVHTTLGGFTADIHMYDLIILEQYEDILKYPNNKTRAGKTIWIPDFAYNMDTKNKENPSFEISALVGDLNKVCTYEPYINYIKPIG